MGRMRRKPTGDLAEAHRALARAAEAVSRGTASLLRAIPSARVPALPLPDALTAFREALDEAEGWMDAWRRPPLEDVWQASREGLAAARDSEERFRLGVTAPLTHEALLAALADLIGPLEPFAEAERRIRSLARERR